MTTKASPYKGAEARTVGEILGDSDPRYTVKKTIEVVKAAVTPARVAAEYGEFRAVGAGRLLGHCVAPDHEDKSPSMYVYDDHFHCYGCGLHGDVVDLERVAGRHLEVWTAVIALSERHGVELPRRSRRWHEWAGEKGRRHDALREVRTKLYQRRFFRMFREDLASIEDPGEREEEARRVWENLYLLARECAAAREDGARG